MAINPYPSLNEQATYNNIVYIWNGNQWVEYKNLNYSFNQIQINKADKFDSFITRNINFEGINLSIYSADSNTIVFSAQPNSNSGTSVTSVTSVTESNNVVTVSKSNNTSSSFTIDAVTSGSYSNGVITLSGTGNVNGTQITGLPTSSSSFTGGTITGPTNFTSGLTANTLSATTYQNLPISGLTAGQNIGISGTNGNFTISVTGITSGTNFTGGTVTGPTNFTSGLTANTLTVTGNTTLANTTGTTFYTNYIDFNTGTTNPSQTGGRVFFDNDSNALSYYGVDNDLLPIAMGQQLYVRVYNNTGVQIDKGKVITITGTSNSLPSAILAVNNHALGTPRPIGVAAENIPNGTEGLVITNGILSGITLNTFANGATLYLSDTIPGQYVDSTSSLSFSARTNEIGYVLQTGSTTGKIYVNINNEDSNLTLTDIERNILEGNVISSGVYEYTGMTQGTGATINVAQARGWIVKNTYEFATLPDVINLYYTGGTNISITNLATADATFILINSASTLVQQTTFPTPQQRRENIFLGKVVHPTRNSITSINQTVDFDVSPMAAIRDLWTPLKLINQGIIVSPHSTNLQINTSAGILWGNGVGWITNQQNPNSISISGTSPTTFQYRTRLGPLTGGSVTTGNTTTIAPGFYDNNGVVTAVGGGSNSSTNQRVFLFPTGLVRIQLGQQVYGNLAAAVAGSQTEQFVEYSLNRENGILIGIISVNKNATNLSLAAQAVFNLVSKFGEVLGGTGGLSTTTLQQAYDNSATPEIVTNSAEGALSIKNGTGGADNVSSLLEGQNAAGTTTSFIRADGAFSGTSIYGTGLTATTISATTYQNLPATPFLPLSGGTITGNVLIDSPTTTNQKALTVFSENSSESIALYGLAGQGTNAYGVYCEVSPSQESFTITNGIGGYFNVGNLFSEGEPTNKYSLQLKDGTEGINKVLTSVTSDGKANWVTPIDDLQIALISQVFS